MTLKINKSILAVLMFVIVATISAKEPMEKELRVRLSYHLPVDPLAIKSMADYDLALCLTDTWFDYDDSRKAKSNLINEWSFDEKNGSYKLTVNTQRKWSNGETLKADQLVWNILRAYKLKTQYGLAIAAIVDLDSISAPDERTIILKTKDHKTSESFFQRMGGQPMAVIHPSDVEPKTLELHSNKITIGPYSISKINSDSIELKKNIYYPESNKLAPTIIHVKPLEQDFHLSNFLNEKSWENVVQVNTFLNEESAQLLSKNKLPIWTRGHDRVSLLKPNNSKTLDSSRRILLALNEKLHSKTITGLPLNVIKATSLQPFGYPLFDQLPNTKNQGHLPHQVKILITNSESSEAQKKLLTPVLKELGVEPIWDIKIKTEFIKLLYEDGKYDLVLFDFGVADPEPSTWIGIITTNEFIHMDKGDLEKFQKTSHITKIEDEIIAFKALLKSSFEKGNYLPLFHFSTLSIGHKNLDFKNIRELDETVNYYKIRLN
jgi:MarR-like DNA-binding transcriptional regulator SgrR of sgrS sRNA